MLPPKKKKAAKKKVENFQEMIDTGKAVYQKSDMPHHNPKFYDSIAFRNKAIDKIMKGYRSGAINKKKK